LAWAGKALLHVLIQQPTVFTPVHQMFTIVVAEIVTTFATMIRGLCILKMTGTTSLTRNGQRGTSIKALQSRKIGALLHRTPIEVAAMAGSRTTDGGAKLMNEGLTLALVMTVTTTAVVIIASFSETMVGSPVKASNIGSRMFRMIHPARMNVLGSQVLDGKPVESNGTIAIATTGTRIKTRKIRIKTVFGWRKRETVLGRERFSTTTTT